MVFLFYLSYILSNRFKLNFGKPKKKSLGTASLQGALPAKNTQSVVISSSLGGHVTSGTTSDDMTVKSSSASTPCSVNAGGRTMSEGKYHLPSFVAYSL